MKKGFTLIELIATILVLGIISLVMIPTVNRLITKARNKMLNEQIDRIVKVTKSYTTEISNSLPTIDQDSLLIFIEDLKNGGYLTKNQIVNPVTKDVMDGCVRVTYNLSSDNYSYEYIDNCSNNNYSDGTLVYFNPETGEICEEAEANSNTSLNTGCLKWYVFDDDARNNQVNLLLSHNTTEGIEWNSVDNTSGPDEIFMEQLNTDTSSWAGVESRNDLYSHNNGVSNYSIDYTNYKARLLTVNEVAEIVNSNFYDELTSDFSLNFDNSSTNPNPFVWLFDYTLECVRCNNQGTAMGYWLATSRPTNTTQVWYVDRAGITNVARVGATNVGIRPVITISKDCILVNDVKQNFNKN